MLGEAVAAESRSARRVAVGGVVGGVDSSRARASSLRGLAADERLPYDLEERRRVRVHGPSEPLALEGSAQEELTLGAGQPDVEEPNLLVVLRCVRGGVAALERNQLVLAPGDQHGVKLEALRRVQRHQPDGVRALILRPGLRRHQQRDALQKLAQSLVARRLPLRRRVPTTILRAVQRLDRGRIARDGHELFDVPHALVAVLHVRDVLLEPDPSNNLIRQLARIGNLDDFAELSHHRHEPAHGLVRARGEAHVRRGRE